MPRLASMSGLIAIIMVGGAVLLGLGPLLLLGVEQGGTRTSPYLARVAFFTLWQAALSTCLSLVVGLAAARALARRRFPGRGWLLRLMVLPQALPAIVVVLGLISLLGRQSPLGGLIPIYGLSGILIAHCFFNIPLAARFILSRLEIVPSDSYRLAAQLRLSGLSLFRHVEWPLIAPALKSAGALIFLLCMASFTIVLILGGGPQATTFEVAIYQALRMDFDPGFAAMLALVQLLFCAIAALAMGRFALGAGPMPRLSTRPPPHLYSTRSLLSDIAALLILALILLPVLCALLWEGFAHARLSPMLLRATLTSLAVGVLATGISLLTGAIFAVNAARMSHAVPKALCRLVSFAPLVVPPAVIATGWFIFLAPLTDVSALAPCLIVLLNALMALPFVQSILEPAFKDSFQRHDRLCESLGITGCARLRLIEIPVLSRPLGLAAALAFSMSLGDLAAVSLFGNSGFLTLPALIYKQMSHYQMADASGTAMLLTLFCASLSYATAHLTRSRAQV